MPFPQTEQLYGVVNVCTVDETTTEPELPARLLVVAGEEYRERLPAVMEPLLRMAIFMVLSVIDGSRSYGACILFNRPRIYMVGTKKFVVFSREEERLVAFMPECLMKDEYAVLTRAWLLTGAGAGVNEGGMEKRIMMRGKTNIFGGKGLR